MSLNFHFFCSVYFLVFSAYQTTPTLCGLKKAIIYLVSNSVSQWFGLGLDDVSFQ